MGEVAKRIAFNPSDKSQFYVLWSSGRVTPRGGALEPSGITQPPPRWDIAADSLGPAVAFQIIDWTEPSGYSVTYFGDVWPWGPSGAIPAAVSPPVASTDPFKVIIDFAMDPTGNGEGYELWSNGNIVAIGGAPAVSVGALFGTPTAKRLAMQYSTKRYYILEQQGGIHQRNGAPVVTPAPFWPGWNTARGLEIIDWLAGRGYLLQHEGLIYPVGPGVEPVTSGPSWPGLDVARDFKVLDDGTDPDFPLKFVMLDANGGVRVFVSSTPPNVVAGGFPLLGPLDPTVDTTRPLLPWSYLDAENDEQESVDMLLFRDTDTAAYTSERQRVKVTGSPTGGTFALRFGGQMTTDLARNASAATVQAALEALWGVTAGSIACSSTLGSVDGMLIDYAGAGSGPFSRCAQPLLQVARMALTGGTAPTVTVTSTVAGTDVFNTKRSAALFKQKSDEPNRRAFDLTPMDLRNDVYRFFIHVRDTAKLWSPTHARVWTQDVVLPATPTLTAVDQGGLDGILLTPTFTDPPAGAKFRIEYSDDYTGDIDTATWLEVRYFQQSGTGSVITDPVVDALWRDPSVRWRDPGISWRGFGTGLVATGDSIVDYEARFGRARWYRISMYTEDPWLSSDPSAPIQATLTGHQWCLIPIEYPSMGRRLSVIPPFDFAREGLGGAVYGAGAKYPTTSGDGPPRAMTSTLDVRLNDIVESADLDAILELGQIMLLRDPFGRAWYCRMLGSASTTLPVASPTIAEQAAGFLTKFIEETKIPLTETRRPPVSQPDPYAVLVPA